MAIELETVGLDEPHLLRQMRRDVSQVGGPLLRGRYVAYEVATVTRDIEHGAVFWDVALEECGDLAPDRILRGGVCIGKTLSVDVFERLAHAGPRSYASQMDRYVRVLVTGGAGFGG